MISEGEMVSQYVKLRHVEGTEYFDLGCRIEQINLFLPFRIYWDSEDEKIRVTVRI